MFKPFLYTNKMFKLSMLAMLISASFTMVAWAADSTDVLPPTPAPAATFLWKTGVLSDVYINPAESSPSSYMVANQCPSNLKPSYNVAVREGYISSSGSSDDKGIRGIHLKVNNFGTDSKYKEIYINFSEAYVDTIGETDKPIDISYWIYCGPT